MKKTVLLLWICRITAATLMLQTLYFKFSGAEESIYIFSTIGIEPWGRIGTGVAELIASILILIPRTSVYGALMAMGIMAGAIISHIFILGIIVQGDGGQLFLYAIIVFICSLYLVYQQRKQLFNLIRK
ncbi:MAG: DoxX family protein [Chitinophagaceae bacterium]|nr:DoxX family protein [Chitinophagaceae bacterium]